MFEALRKMIFPIILIVLLLFVAMIVLQWGREITLRDRFGAPNVAGVVNGEQIPLDQYNRVYENLYRAEADKSSQEVPDARVKELEQQAWQQLVHDKLLMQQVAKHNIVVTDREIYTYLRMSPPQYLQESPSFQTDGKFDYQKYMQAMADPQAASFWASLEPMIQSDLKKMKMQEMIISAVEVTENEVKDAFLAGTEKIRVGYIDVPMKRYATRLWNITDDQVRQYFDAHKDNYHQEDRASLNLAVIEKKPGAADSAAAYATIKAIYDSIKAGADFAEMARAHSQDGSAGAGGDLGFFAKGQMVQPFDQRAFSLKDGDISEPFQTQFGWHIIQHHGYQDFKETPRGKTAEETVRKAHVSHILIKVDVSQSTIDADYQKLTEFQTAAKELGFQKAAEDAGIQMMTTQPFARQAPIDPPVGFSQSANDFAFSADPKAISDIMENGSAIWVAQVAQRMPAGPAAFDDVKVQVRLDLQKDMIDQMCLDTAKALYAQIRGGTDPQTVAKREGLEYVQTDPFTRTSNVAGFGYDPKAVGMAFSMSTVGQYAEPFTWQGGAMIMQLLDRQAPDLTAYNEKRDSVYNAVKMAKQQEMYSNWYQNLLKSSKVENDIDKLRSRGGEAL